MLVLAATGSASQANQELVGSVAESAAMSCPGVTITIGYLGAPADTPATATTTTSTASTLATADPQPSTLTDALSAALASASDPGDGWATCAVVVPLLAGPHPVFDAQIDAALGQASSRTSGEIMLAGHLGPHPLLAGALHERLSQAGLARAGRALGLNVSHGANGVLVVAVGGAQAVSDAGLTAVLLAARLAVPAAPAALEDQASIDAAVSRLREAGATRLAVAPCVIGPETGLVEFERLASALGAQMSGPLGAHPAIAQLVAIRYGEALARISVDSH